MPSCLKELVCLILPGHEILLTLYSKFTMWILYASFITSKKKRKKIEKVLMLSICMVQNMSSDTSLFLTFFLKRSSKLCPSNSISAKCGPGTSNQSVWTTGRRGWCSSAAEKICVTWLPGTIAQLCNSSSAVSKSCVSEAPNRAVENLDGRTHL